MQQPVIPPENRLFAVRFSKETKRVTLSLR